MNQDALEFDPHCAPVLQTSSISPTAHRRNQNWWFPHRIWSPRDQETLDSESYANYRTCAIRGAELESQEDRTPATARPGWACVSTCWGVFERHRHASRTATAER